MRRHSEAELRERPELRLADVNASRRACERFARVPTSVMNFVEGTRFTPSKHRTQHSPYRHLLKPKVGALALALEVLGSRFDSLLDVTIVYPDGVPTFWQFLCGGVRSIVVRAQRIAIPAEVLRGDYTRDTQYRKTFQSWLQKLWEQKDRRIDEIDTRVAASAGRRNSDDGSATRRSTMMSVGERSYRKSALWFSAPFPRQQLGRSAVCAHNPGRGAGFDAAARKARTSLGGST